MSKDSRLFTIAGTSTFRGKNTWRFATGSAHNRQLVLERNEHVDVKLIDLPKPMTKAEAIEYLKSEAGVQAVMPKTGRGSALTPEEIAAQEQIIIEKKKAQEAALEEAKKSDEDFINNLS